MGSNDNVLVVQQLWCDFVLPQWDNPFQRNFQVFTTRNGAWVQVGVATVLSCRAFVIGTQQWRQHVVGTTPNVHLFVTILFSCLLLVLALQSAIVTFVQTPSLEFRNPKLVAFFQCVVQRLDRTLQNRSVGVVKFQTVFLQCLTGSLCLFNTFWSQVNVYPASKLVGLVPFTLTVTNQY